MAFRIMSMCVRPKVPGGEPRADMSAMDATPAAQRRAVDVLETARADLAAGRWQAAVSSFQAALADFETPEALEGLSWAAWWLDDAAAVLDARERAFRRYRTSGQPAAAARMAIWIATDQLDFQGAFAVATGWLRHAARLLDGLAPGPEHGWLAFNEGYFAYLRGDTTTVLERAAHVTELGRRLDVADLEMLGLALNGTALVAWNCWTRPRWSCCRARRRFP
jgi:LuxR family maltose regulon positive regulatory protein